MRPAAGGESRKRASFFVVIYARILYNICGEFLFYIGDYYEIFEA